MTNFASLVCIQTEIGGIKVCHFHLDFFKELNSVLLVLITKEFWHVNKWGFQIRLFLNPHYFRLPRKILESLQKEYYTDKLRLRLQIDT